MVRSLDPASKMVTKLFMRLVNAEEKTLLSEKRVKATDCPAEGQLRVNAILVEGGPVDVEAGVFQPRTSVSIACESRASHSTSMTVSLAGSRVKMRWWLTSMMLTPHSCELGGDRGERARPVMRGDLQAGDAAAADQLADQHIGQQMRVDIAAAQDRADLPSAEAVRDRRG